MTIYRRKNSTRIQKARNFQKAALRDNFNYLIVSSGVRRALNVINDVAKMTKKWRRMYGMHQWPPVMPSTAAPHFEDWLMAPIIMILQRRLDETQGRKDYA